MAEIIKTPLKKRWLKIDTIILDEMTITKLFDYITKMMFYFRTIQPFITYSSPCKQVI